MKYFLLALTIFSSVSALAGSGVTVLRCKESDSAEKIIYQVDFVKYEKGILKLFKTIDPRAGTSEVVTEFGPEASCIIEGRIERRIDVPN